MKKKLSYRERNIAIIFINFFLIISLALLLSGCGISESGELMSDARKFIDQGEYQKAMTNLSKVLEEDESNSEARGMYYQALKLHKADKAKFRKDYEQEIKELKDLLNDKSGSAKIRDKAEEMLEQAEKAYRSQKKAIITRKENAKKTAEENKGKYTSGSIYGQKSFEYERDNNRVNSQSNNINNNHGSSGNGINSSSNGGNNTGSNNNSQNGATNGSNSNHQQGQTGGTQGQSGLQGQTGGNSGQN